jgi:hypothetical protein
MFREQVLHILKGGTRNELCDILTRVRTWRGELDSLEAQTLGAIHAIDKESVPTARLTDLADDLVDRTGASRHGAARSTRRAQLLDELQAVAEALAAGRITSAHADLLAAIPPSTATRSSPSYLGFSPRRRRRRSTISPRRSASGRTSAHASPAMIRIRPAAISAR